MQVNAATRESWCGAGMSCDTFDAVVIGSGLGGLTAAALLSKAGQKVCVLERNHSLGGAASAFKVGALTIEASLHQTANPRDPRDPKHHILKELGILDDLEWVPISPFFSVRGGPIGQAFDLPHGFSRARQALAERFSDKSRAIDRVLGQIEKIHAGVAALGEARAQHSLGKLVRGALSLRPVLAGWRTSLADVLAREFGDNEALKCALAANLGYYADDPSQLWWPFFAVAQGGYLASGGTYIKGGSRQLSMKLAKVVTKTGGVVRLGREAIAMEIGDGATKPTLVRHVDRKSRGHEEQIAARRILANCAPSTVAGMLTDPMRDVLEQAYSGRALSVSLFSAHFGVREPPARVGLERYSTVVLPQWMGALGDVAGSARVLAEAPTSRLPILGIANFGAIEAGISQGSPTLVSVVGLDHVDNWAGLTKDAERERRERWLDAILGELDRIYPGFAGIVTDKTLLTARSMRDYLNTPNGAIYGFAPRPPEQPFWTGLPRSCRTPIPGLYLASAFGGSGGFTGAMLAGANAARLALAKPG